MIDATAPASATAHRLSRAIGRVRASVRLGCAPNATSPRSAPLTHSTTPQTYSPRPTLLRSQLGVHNPSPSTKNGPPDAGQQGGCRQDPAQRPDARCGAPSRSPAAAAQGTGRRGRSGHRICSGCCRAGELRSCAAKEKGGRGFCMMVFYRKCAAGAAASCLLLHSPPPDPPQQRSDHRSASLLGRLACCCS